MSHQTPGRSPPETSRRGRQDAAHFQRARRVTGPPVTGSDQVYLGVVDGAAPADRSLTPRLVSAGRPTGGRTESGSLMPAQQRLSLRAKRNVSLGAASFLQTPSQLVLHLCQQRSLGPLQNKEAFLQVYKRPIQGFLQRHLIQFSCTTRTGPRNDPRSLTAETRSLPSNGRAHQHPDRTEPGSVQSSQSEPTPSAWCCQNRVSPGRLRYLEHTDEHVEPPSGLLDHIWLFYIRNVDSL